MWLKLGDTDIPTQILEGSDMSFDTIGHEGRGCLRILHNDPSRLYPHSSDTPRTTS